MGRKVYQSQTDSKSCMHISFVIHINRCAHSLCLFIKCTTQNTYRISLGLIINSDKRNMELMKSECLILCVIILLMSAIKMEAQLQVGFYATTCPQAEFIVRNEVAKAVNSNAGIAAGLIRMHFHDCFVRGCDGSVLIDSTSTANPAEKDSPINNPSLRGFEVIDNAKAKLEQACSGVVSCADILAFAARDSVALTGAVSYQVPGGRRDGRVSNSAETFTNLPSPNSDVSTLTQNFANKGLTQNEMVTLSGAHTVGVSHCTSFSSRLYNFSSTGQQDPSLDPVYATKLKQQCPQGSSDATLTVPMDPRSPNNLDRSYYTNILANQGLFTSDQVLGSDGTTGGQVRVNSLIPLLWKGKFILAMVKMGQIGVLTGSDGEIRTNCRVIN